MFLEHPSSLEHDTGADGADALGVVHPEQAGRITAIERELSTRGWFGFERVRAPAVDRSVPGSGDEVWVSLIEHLVVPLAYAFEPQLVVISAGYDAHRDDPGADCTVTEEG